MYQHNPELPRPIDVIPHRPPHLWLDGVFRASATGAHGFWTPGSEHFEGHFEGMPLLPGVKLVESIAQIGAYAVMSNSDESVLGIFKGIESTSFDRPVRPGETLDLAVVILDRTKRDFKALGAAKVNGIQACETTIIGTLLPERMARRLLET